MKFVVLGLFITSFCAGSSMASFNVTAETWYDGQWHCSAGSSEGRLFLGRGQGPTAQSGEHSHGRCESNGCLNEPRAGRFVLNRDGATTYLTERQHDNESAAFAATDNRRWALRRNSNWTRLDGTIGESEPIRLVCWRPGLRPATG